MLREHWLVTVLDSIHIATATFIIATLLCKYEVHDVDVHCSLQVIRQHIILQFEANSIQSVHSLFLSLSLVHCWGCEFHREQSHWRISVYGVCGETHVSNINSCARALCNAIGIRSAKAVVFLSTIIHCVILTHTHTHTRTTLNEIYVLTYGIRYVVQ